ENDQLKDILIVDCGIGFPSATELGVDLLIPDIRYLLDKKDKIRAMLLTHGHEDHIGAVPYLLRLRPDLPLVASRLTLALVEAKLAEHRITPRSLEVKEGQVEKLGPFTCEFIAVNHSIPDALAVAVRTSAGVVLHTGDFKMDQLPLDGRITDLNALARLGDAGVDLLLVDSTNAEVPGFVTSEREIEPVIDSVFARATGRVIVACFASHVHRVQQIIDAAATHGRKVALVGRSMLRNMAVAKDLGYLHVPEGIIVSSEDVMDMPDDEVVLICTGSQGEPMAVLSRIANRNHAIEVDEGDTVVLASSLIPGNENAVSHVINGLTKWGAKVVHKGNALVHVSGHAAQGELTYLYNIVKPRHVLPVHGEWRHLRAQAQVAMRTGIAKENVLLAEDGVVVDLVDGHARITGYVPCGYVYVDGSSVGALTDADLKDRRILGDEGFVSVVVVVDLVGQKVVAGPDIHARGAAEDGAAFDEVVPLVRVAVEEALRRGVTDRYELSQIVRRTLGSWVGKKLRRKPMIVPMVIEV
ncbi:MAG: ribonuclease J, partial [Actinobacteria bacterium]|nr:ribonuclease J [Actinomycetota bacterium]